MTSGDIIEGVLRGLAGTVPGLIAAIATSGAKTDEEAIKVAREYAARMGSGREAQGGDDTAGDWDHDKAARIAAGSAPTVPPNPFEPG